MVAPPVTNPPSNVRVVDDEIAGRPRPEDLVRVSAPLTSELTAELDAAVGFAGVGVEECCSRPGPSDRTDHQRRRRDRQRADRRGSHPALLRD